MEGHKASLQCQEVSSPGGVIGQGQGWPGKVSPSSNLPPSHISGQGSWVHPGVAKPVWIPERGEKVSSWLPLMKQQTHIAGELVQYPAGQPSVF